MAGRIGDMPLIIDYSLCNQAVTIYSYDEGVVTRRECPRAYFEMTEKETIDNTGEHGKTEHLIVIPEDIECSPGCRVYLGIGSEPGANAAQWWRSFIPAKNDKVVVVRSVSPRYWQGAVVHVELRG